MAEPTTQPDIKLGIALIPVVFLVAALTVTIKVFELDAHIPLISAAAVAGIVAVFHGVKWKEIEKGMTDGINLAMGAILILMVVGTLIGTWILGGVVPTMIYYGLRVLSPGIFLVATLLICSIVSLGTGSSWSTAGTVGVALIGVGGALQIPLPMVAGAIISGARRPFRSPSLKQTLSEMRRRRQQSSWIAQRRRKYPRGPFRPAVQAAAERA